MFAFESDAMLVDDREDLIQVLRMRFNDIPGRLIEEIYEIHDFHSLQRLILAAANAADWQTFLNEFQVGMSANRLVGERFNPMADLQTGGEHFDGTKEE